MGDRESCGEGDGGGPAPREILPSVEKNFLFERLTLARGFALVRRKKRDHEGDGSVYLGVGGLECANLGL